MQKPLQVSDCRETDWFNQYFDKIYFFIFATLWLLTKYFFKKIFAFQKFLPDLRSQSKTVKSSWFG